MTNSDNVRIHRYTRHLFYSCPMFSSILPELTYMRFTLKANIHAHTIIQHKFRFIFLFILSYRHAHTDTHITFLLLLPQIFILILSPKHIHIHFLIHTFIQTHTHIPIHTSHFCFCSHNYSYSYCHPNTFRFIFLFILISNYDWFCENSCTHPSKKKERTKWMKTQIYSLTSSSLFQAIHLTFSFSIYHLFATKYASILSIHWFQTPSEWVQRSSDFLGLLRQLFQSSSCTVHISMMETTSNCKVWGLGCMVDASSHFSVAVLKSLLHMSSYMRPSTVLMKNPLSKKLHYFYPLTSQVFFFFYHKRSRHLSSHTSYTSKD